MKKQAVRVLMALCTSAAVFSATTAYADTWPSKPIRLVVPFPAGGTADTIARLVGNEISKSVGQPVVVDNKPGANGMIGSDAVAKSAPDGYTLLLSGIGSNAIDHGLYAKVPYNSATDFSHITQLISGPNVLVVNPSFPAKTLKELVAVLKANPGKYNYASAGNGSSGHLSMEMLKQTAGLDVSHVPYKGGSPAVTDVLSGQVPMLFINQDTALPHVKAGKLRALAVTSPAQNPVYPGVPTVAESGFPKFSAVSWVGLSAPAGTPKEIISRLNAEAVKALHSPSVAERLNSVGFVAVGSTPAQYSEFIKAETEKWRKVIKAAGVQPD